ncbi:class I SAM-dependent methyltransferase [Magnetospirillum aberrantis]|uniref:Class I SAM-dependent methyltransferase n=1 Tax=Magnetospirillum aberrantis SpK TaxID=908842 RepID=A0A7C9UVF1_9PROT|nr:class I SAM-dependent methyltransferase [Magnetospirillum aberrantis]NFV81547.1 class I SAM-dependent methyltransferase [Magnetospirillum aberrantis SpK]
MVDSAGSAGKKDIQRFWKSLYESLYDDVDSGLTRDSLLQAVDDLEDMFRLRRQMATVELDLSSIRGKRVLEVGPGAGGHSALLARHGAVMTSIDVTFDRARATQRKFELMGELASGCAALQGDAENLPFADATFDIVYSNGVLHHTYDTERAIAEVHRVLKPGGQAVIMLYCKDSWHYWVNLVLCTGLLRGAFLRGRNWVGQVTEWGGKKRQTVDNPITRCYSRAEMKGLFAAFRDVTLRKHEFYWYLFPLFGRRVREYLRRKYGEHPGGVLVYGEPWPMWSPSEAKLGPIMGWNWYVSARKTD